MYKQIAANKRNTVFIMLGFVAFIAAIGAIFAYVWHDWWIVAYVLVIAAIYAVFQYFAASSLATAMTGAKEIKKRDNPRLYNTVENLAITAGLLMPRFTLSTTQRRMLSQLVAIPNMRSSLRLLAYWTLWIIRNSPPSWRTKCRT